MTKVAAAGLLAVAVGCSGPSRKGPATNIDLPRARAQALAKFDQAGREQSRKKFDKAEALYREGLSLDDDIAGAWNNYGVVLLEQGKYMEAVPAFGRAADLSPSDPTPYENLGLLYHRAGYSKEALEAYGRSLERDPNWLPSLRGATVCAKLLNHSDEESLDRAKRALLIEREETWRKIFQSQRVRIENDLKEDAVKP
ncbi:MAG: tetratricopeptide repeat protein [Phycisphaerales bacterium]